MAQNLEPIQEMINLQLKILKCWLLLKNNGSSWFLQYSALGANTLASITEYWNMQMTLFYHFIYCCVVPNVLTLYTPPHFQNFLTIKPPFVWGIRSAYTHPEVLTRMHPPASEDNALYPGFHDTVRCCTISQNLQNSWISFVVFRTDRAIFRPFRWSADV